MVAPVAPTVLYVIFVITVLIHFVWASVATAELKVIVFAVQGLRTNKMPPFRSAEESVAPPAPVAPVDGFNAQRQNL